MHTTKQLLVSVFLITVASGLKVIHEETLQTEKLSQENRLCLSAKLTVKPEFRDEFIKMETTNAQQTLATEHGASQFSWGESTSEPNAFHFHEEYLGQSAFDDHKKTPHFAAWTDFENKGGLAAKEFSFYQCAAPPAEKQTLRTYSDPDQKARHAQHVAENNQRVLDIDSVFKGADLKGKRVLVTGTDKGLGLALVKELVKHGAKVSGTCRHSSPELDAVLAGADHQILTKVDVTSDEAVAKMAQEVSGPVDILINNAGYFYGPVETLDTMAFKEESKMFEICAVGPLRVTSELRKAGKLKSGSKVSVITSQGGSVAWRTTQNPEGHDYGHHMSKAAANMGARLLAQELKHEGISVVMLHPGFARTEMTKKYEKIWDEEGAVETHVAAKRVLHEVNQASMESTGSFINCEDGLNIPF